MFEYHSSALRHMDDIPDTCNSLAADGWRLVAHVYDVDHGRHVLTFERPKEGRKHRIGRDDYNGPG